MKPFFTKKAPYKESDISDQQAFGRNKKKPNQRDDSDRYSPPPRHDPPYRNDRNDLIQRNDNYGQVVQYVAREEFQETRDNYKENKRNKKNRNDGQKVQVYQGKRDGNSNGYKQNHQSVLYTPKEEIEGKTQQDQKSEQIQEVPLSQNEAKTQENNNPTPPAKEVKEQEKQEVVIKEETKVENPQQVLKGNQDPPIQQQNEQAHQPIASPENQQPPTQAQQTQNQVIGGTINSLKGGSNIQSPIPAITPQINGFQQSPVMNPQIPIGVNPYLGGISTLPPQYFAPQQFSPYMPYQPYYPHPQNDPKQSIIQQQICIGGHLISTQFPFTDEGIQSCHKFLTDLLQNNKK